MLLFTKIICKLVQRKYQRMRKQYNHVWVSKTSDGMYWASRAVKHVYDNNTRKTPMYSSFVSTQEEAEVIAAVMEVMLKPVLPITEKLGYLNYIEDTSLLKAITFLIHNKGFIYDNARTLQ